MQPIDSPQSNPSPGKLEEVDDWPIKSPESALRPSEAPLLIKELADAYEDPLEVPDIWSVTGACLSPPGSQMWS